MKYKSITPDNAIEEIHKIHPNLPLKPLQDIIAFAISAHEGQHRQSGEPYITHPLSVAYILAKMQLDFATIAAGILHDVVEDTTFSKEDVSKLYGEEIADLVDGVTKIETLKYKTQSRRQKQAENFRKLLFAITKDVRVIIIKLADRLHNMRTLHFTPPEKQKRVAKETLDIYTPLANRFGLALIRFELEDLSLKYLHPEEYKKIGEIVAQKKTERESFMQTLLPNLKSLLEKNNIQSEVKGRTKHFYSIYRKNKIRKVPYDEIYDLIAVRIIVQTIPECYLVMGIIHQAYEHIDRIRDYIAKPKANGYQSLHTIIIGPKQKNLEIQIRTTDMHHVAEEGVAAHWKYKALKKFDDQSFANSAKELPPVKQQFDKQVQWIKSILQNNDHTITSLIQNAKTDFFPDIIIVITPEGDFVELPKGATPLDFAFSIHTEVGLHCVGARINGKIAPLRTELHNSDTIEIITANQPTASKDWFHFLHSSHARTKLRAYFNRQEMQLYAENGKLLFDKKFRRGRDKITDKEVETLLKKMHVNTLKNLYIEIGKETISNDDIVKTLATIRDIKEKPKQTDIEENDGLVNQWLENLRKGADGIIIDNLKDIVYRFAKCCNPIPGDNIIGYITQENSISIHKSNCPNPNFRALIQAKSPRLIPVEWNKVQTQSNIQKAETSIRITGNLKKNFMLEILNFISTLNIEVVAVETIRNESVETLKIKILVQSKKEKMDLIKHLRSKSGIESVKG